MKKIHQAILIESDKNTGIKWASDFIKNNFNVQIKGNPDFEIIKTERFNIENARKLKTRSSQAPLGKYQFFIIACENILREAQNALLKLFEEPPKNTFFIVILPAKNSLLPTVLSRMEYKGKINFDLKEKEFAKLFISSSIKKRIKMLEPIIKNKDRKTAKNIVDAIEEMLHSEGVLKNSKSLYEINFIRQYLGDKSSSIKMLLEHLAITI